VLGAEEHLHGTGVGEEAGTAQAELRLVALDGVALPGNLLRAQLKPDRDA